MAQRISSGGGTSSGVGRACRTRHTNRSLFTAAAVIAALMLGLAGTGVGFAADVGGGVGYDSGELLVLCHLLPSLLDG